MQIAAPTLVPQNVNLVRALRYDFCSESHANAHCVLEGYMEEAHYAGNYQKPDPYVNTYSPWWDDHSNINRSKD